MSRLSSNTTIEERKRGCIFAEDFQNESRVKENGGIVTGTVTLDKGYSSDGGGSTNFLTYNNTFNSVNEFTILLKGLIFKDGARIINLNESVDYPRISRISANGRLLLQVSSTNFLYSASDFDLDKEYDVAITVDKTTDNCKIYLNGNLDISGTLPNSIYDDFGNIMIGKITGATVSSGMDLKEVKIFDRQLTPMEIYQDYKQDTEFDDVVYTDLDNSNWSDTANITKEQLATFEGAADVMKITATAASGITINTNPAIPTEVGMLYKATLRVWVPSVDGGVAWYQDTSADGNPRNTTTLTEQWVDLDVYFIATAITTQLWLNPVANGNSVYVDTLTVSKFNQQVCDVDLRFNPEDFNGTSVKNHADATNPFIVDGELPTQLKYGGMKFDGSTTGLVSTNPLNTKWHQVENYIVAFRKEPTTANSYVFANRDTAGGGLGILLNETNGTIENYVGTTGLATINSPFYGINVFIIQRVFNRFFVYNNGNYIGTDLKGGTGIYTGGKNLWIGKRGDSTSLRFKGDILRLKHTYGYMNEKQVQKCTYDFLRSIKGGETL